MAIKPAMRDKTNGSHDVGDSKPQESAAGNAILDWFEKSCALDLLGCDENCTMSRDLVNEALRGLPRQRKPQRDLHAVDYAALHDELLESLLSEQARQMGKSSSSSTASPLLPEELYNAASFGDNSSAVMLDDDDDNGAESPRKRRSVRLHRRRTPPRIRKNRVAPLAADDASKLDTSSCSASAVSLMDLSKTVYPNPADFLHPQCRMQKDKGRGEAVGASICAKGSEACLGKLRAKMRLLAEHATCESNKRGVASIKRRKAKVSERYENFVETRSLIELRMGFLSMQYGVLLRWDTGRTGKATLVVLRKMCHESFYSKQKPVTPPRKEIFVEERDHHTASHHRHVLGKEDAILQQRPDGTEVSLLVPPYRIPRPDTFSPAVLRIAVLDASGFNRKSNWSIQMSYEGSVENVPLMFDPERATFSPKARQTVSRIIDENESPQLTACEIHLFEHRRHRRVHRVQRRLVTTMRVPLFSLQPQSRKNPVPTRVRLPFNHDRAASVHLELLLESDYAAWLEQELEARREEEKGFSWRRPSSLYVEDEEEQMSPWEWICCSVC